MSDRALPPQPPGGVDLAVHEEGQGDSQGDVGPSASADAPALKASPIPVFELGDLSPLMLNDPYDEDETEGTPEFDFGPPVLGTIRLPLDELERLLVLTGAKTAANDAPLDRAQRDPSATPMPGQGQAARRSTPVPSTPRTMRGVEILLGAPMEAFDSAASAAFDARAHGEQRQRRSRWTIAGGVAAAALVGAIASGICPGLFSGQPKEESAEAAEASTATKADEGPASVARVDNDLGLARAFTSRASLTEPKAVTAGMDTKAATLSAARAALTRLRAGVIACARETIGVLPETSPAVPADLKLTQGEGYTSAKRDWGTPAWSCAGFELNAPQRFQIQWQAVRENVEGLGVAWIDDDDDGAPDRALAFHANLIEQWQPDAGDVEPIDPAIPSARAPR